MKLCLVVDDSSVIRKVAKAILNSMGYEVHEAESGQEAIDFCAKQMPSAILIDWDLPDMSGFDFLVQFNGHFTGPRPHMVYATTENDPMEISRAATTGADAIMMVPFDREAIEAKFPHAAAA